MGQVLAGVFLIAAVIGWKALVAAARRGKTWTRPTILLAVTAAGAVIVAFATSQGPERDALEANTIIRKLDEGGWQAQRRDRLSDPKGEELTQDAELVFTQRDKVKGTLEAAGYTVLTADPDDLADREAEDMREERPSEAADVRHVSPARKGGLISVFER